MSTRKRTPDEPADVIELVPGTGITIPRTFRGFVVMPDNAGHWVLDIEMDVRTRKPKLKNFCATYHDAVPVDKLGAIDVSLDELVVQVVTAQTKQALSPAQAALAGLSEAETFVAANTVGHTDVAVGPHTPQPPDPEVLAEVERLAKALMTPGPGRPPRPDEFKLELLEAYEKEGMEHVTTKYGIKERTVQGYLRDARQIRAERAR